MELILKVSRNTGVPVKSIEQMLLGVVVVAPGVGAEDVAVS